MCKEDRDVLEKHMGEIDECYIGEFGTQDNRAKAIVRKKIVAADGETEKGSM